MFKTKYRELLKQLLMNIENLKQYKGTARLYAQLLIAVGGDNFGLIRKRVLENIDTAKANYEYQLVLALETILLNIDDIENLVLMEHIRRLTEE